MAEYIEREALIKAIENDCLELVYYTKEDAVQCVKAIPADDVAPVVHAYWDDSGRYRFERDGSLAIPCSNCGCALKEDEYKKYIWSYCPKCGARMDADTQEREGV